MHRNFDLIKIINYIAPRDLSQIDMTSYSQEMQKFLAGPNYTIEEIDRLGLHEPKINRIKNAMMKQKPTLFHSSEQSSLGQSITLTDIVIRQLD